MSIPARFARIASAVSAKVGAPFVAAQILQDATPGSYDDAGTFIPGTPASPLACKCQIDAATEYMKAQEGFADNEVRFVILRDGSLALGTDARINVLDGPNAGIWLVASLSLDPAAIGWTGKGRRA